MPIEIEATYGAVDANSYVTLDEAEEYFATRLFSEVWRDTGDDQKVQALITACRSIENMRLKVIRNLSAYATFNATDQMQAPMILGQALAFPRMGDRAPITNAYVIPLAVKRAQLEEAIALLSFGQEQQARSTLQAQGVTSATIGRTSETYDKGTALSQGLISPEARRLIAPYVSRTGVIATSPYPQGEIPEWAG